MKQIYNMIDGIPIWQHLKNGVAQNNIDLTASDYGKFAEILGQRILHELTERGGILNDMFPGTDIVSVQKSPRMRILDSAKVEMGDLALEISYKDSCSDNFGKKIVIFEIKHGRSPIEQNQLRRYCSMVNNPGEYFSKADEVRIVFLMIEKINTNKRHASYSISELDKVLVAKILENSPVISSDNIDNFKISNGQDQGIVDKNISDGLNMIKE